MQSTLPTRTPTPKQSNTRNQVIPQRTLSPSRTTLTPCAPATASIAGATAGILGLTNWHGFAFHLLSNSIVGLLFLLYNARTQPEKYYAGGGKEILLNGTQDGLFPFILFWTCSSFLLRYALN